MQRLDFLLLYPKLSYSSPKVRSKSKQFLRQELDYGLEIFSACFPIYATQRGYPGMQPPAPPAVLENEEAETDSHTRNSNVDRTSLKNQILAQATYCFGDRVKDFYKDAQSSATLEPTEVFNVLFNSSRLTLGQLRAALVTTQPWSAPTLVLHGDWNRCMHGTMRDLFEKLAEIAEKEITKMKAGSQIGSQRGGGCE